LLSLDIKNTNYGGMFYNKEFGYHFRYELKFRGWDKSGDKWYTCGDIISRDIIL
jgi:hypothetical protein